MQTARQELTLITDQLLNESLGYGEVRNACLSLYHFFCRLTGYEEKTGSLRSHLSTGAGIAIDTCAAALCITDFRRTQQFLLGLNEAVSACRQRNPFRPVQVLYAGTGPFASLMTPLTTRWSAGELQFAALEINPESLYYLKKLRELLGLESHVISLSEVDATQYRIPDTLKPDILLTETMMPALEKEPQAAIVANLIPQCPVSTLLIPEQVTVSALLHGNLQEEPDACYRLGSLFQLDADWARAGGFDATGNDLFTRGIELPIPLRFPWDYPRLSLDTHIRIAGSRELKRQESGITLLRNVKGLSDWKDVRALHFLYRRGALPSFDIKPLG